MEEAHNYGSMHNYVLTLEGGSDANFPLVKLPKQVEQAVRDSMKGQKREWVDKNGADARLAGVKVGRIDCYTESYGYTVHPDDEVGRRIKDRNKLLGSLRAHTLHELDTDQGHFSRIPPYDSRSYRERVME